MPFAPFFFPVPTNFWRDFLLWHRPFIKVGLGNEGSIES